MALYYTGFGGNLPDTREVFREALGLLGGYAEIRGVSRVCETEPQDRKDQPNFLNMVVSCVWENNALSLLAILNHVESRLGRIRNPLDPKGPRVIDLDLVYSDGPVIDLPGLHIPHLRMHSRRFVLEPLLELCPDQVHPRTGRLLSSHLKDCMEQGIYSVWPLG